MHAFTAVLALALAASAAPTPSLNKRGCNPMPSKVDPNIRDTVYKTVKSRGGNDHVMLATMAAAITESLVNNLNCGDKDSVGIFQQRPSQGWGSVGQIMDPVYSTNKFLDVLIPLEKKQPNQDAGVLAQEVQNAEAGNQYTKNLDFARQLIAQAKASVGDSAPAPPPSKPAPPPSQPAPPSKPAPTASAPAKPPINVAPAPTAAPAPPSDGGDDGDDEDCDDSDDGDDAPQPPINTAPKPSVPGACAKTYTVVAGDVCYKLADMFKITLDQLYKLNPDIDSQCHNLQINQQYCVDASAL